MFNAFSVLLNISHYGKAQPRHLRATHSRERTRSSSGAKHCVGNGALMEATDQQTADEASRVIIEAMWRRLKTKPLHH